jgi:hypothetical protein
VNAEAAVMREITDLNTRFDNFAEWMLWQALTGTLAFDYPDVQASVDYKFLASHKPHVGTSWATATPDLIIADIKAWKRLVQRDGRVRPTTAYVTEPTIDRVFAAFAKAGTAAPGSLLSDRMKDQYYNTGTLPGFMGLDWQPQVAVYDANGDSYKPGGSYPGTETGFIADDAIILGNFTENRPVEVLVGPSADDEAPEGFTGKFAKTWKEKDPSARQYLLEWTLLPVVTRPEQWVYVADVKVTA